MLGFVAEHARVNENGFNEVLFPGLCQQIRGSNYDPTAATEAYFVSVDTKNRCILPDKPERTDKVFLALRAFDLRPEAEVHVEDDAI